MEAYELEALGLRVFWDTPAESQDALAHCVHRHSFCEMHILLKNSCALQTEDGVVTVKQGQFCLIAPNVSHATETKAEQFRRVILSIEVRKANTKLGSFLVEWLKQYPVYVGQNALLPILAEQLNQPKGKFYREHIRALLSLILVEAAGALAPVEASSAALPAGDEARSMVLDDFLNGHFAENGAEEALAKRMGLSRRQLDRVMHSHYGMGYREKIAQIRLEVACDLLRRTDLSVQAVAERVGYSTASNFTVFFRKHKGKTPTEYRNHCK